MKSFPTEPSEVKSKEVMAPQFVIKKSVPTEASDATVNDPSVESLANEKDPGTDGRFGAEKSVRDAQLSKRKSPPRLAKEVKSTVTIPVFDKVIDVPTLARDGQLKDVIEPLMLRSKFPPTEVSDGKLNGPRLAQLEIKKSTPTTARELKLDPTADVQFCKSISPVIPRAGKFKAGRDEQSNPCITVQVPKEEQSSD